MTTLVPGAAASLRPAATAALHDAARPAASTAPPLVTVWCGGGVEVVPTSFVGELIQRLRVEGLPVEVRADHLPMLPRPRRIRRHVGRLETVTGAYPTGDLIIVVSGTLEPDRGLLADLAEPGAPILLVTPLSAAGRAGVRVGPLVTANAACVRCVDLQRTRVDPDWPMNLMNLTRSTGKVTDPVVADWAVSTVVCQVHAWWQSGSADTVGHSLELYAHEFRLRSEVWRRQAGCGCGEAVTA
ncbi:hypothetical protein [Parenemella sanctibonifatiensis]|uniref:hypothetical protein n=1 Tax=Parenemella sanctibonifatiensis TaxID=2016505 RepID=UPI0011864E36|nr:hypothetical protein [Parenemella sanctibonifatiensis]